MSINYVQLTGNMLQPELRQTQTGKTVMSASMVIKGYGESFEIDTLPKLIKDNYKIKEIQLKDWYPVDNEYDKKIIESFLKKNKK